MAKVLRWLVLPAMLFGGMLAFSTSQADAGRMWARTYYPACYGCGYVYRPYVAADFGWAPTYVGAPSFNCQTCPTTYVAPSIQAVPVSTGCTSGCTSCGY